MTRKRAAAFGMIGIVALVIAGAIAARQFGAQDGLNVNLTAAEAVQAASRVGGPSQTVEGVGLLPQIGELHEVWPDLAESPYLRSKVDGPIWVVFTAQGTTESSASARAVYIIDDTTGEAVLVSQEIPGRRLEGQ